MANGGDVIFNFKGDDKQLKETTKSATSTLKSIKKLVAGIGIGKMASDFIRTGIQFNAEIEKYQTALTTLTGSAEKASKIISDIKKDASQTPFDVKGLTQANQLLISAGLEADDARKTILALGDAVSATGGGSDELSRMAVNLQQIKNLGKASSIDIKQFAMAGIDIYGLLADYLGITKKEAAEMEVTWDNLNGALIKASQSGGKYFGAMEKQSKTLNGQWSTLKDNFQEFAGKALAPVVKILTNNLLPALNDLITGAQNIKNFIEEHKNGLILLTGVIATLTAAVAAYTIAKNLDLIVVWAYVTATNVATAATTAFGTVLAFLTSPITLVVLAIGGLITAGVLLAKNWEQVKNALGNAVNGIKGFFSNLGAHIGEKVNNIKTKIGEFGSKFGQLPGEIWKHLTNAYNKFVNFVVNLATKAKEGIRTVINNIKNGFSNLPGNMLNIGKNIVQGLWNGIGNTAQWLFNKIKSFKDAVLNKFKSFFGINSPSTLFRDEVGIFMAQGIGEGFTDEMSSVSKQMNKALATVGLGDMFEMSPTLNRTTSNSNNVNIQVINNMETDFMGNIVNNIKTFTNGAKNDYNYGMAQ